MSAAGQRVVEEAKRSPSAFIASLLAKAELPSTVIPFPVRDALGQPIAEVRIRLLNQAEEDLAYANARAYVGRITRGEENVEWKPEEIEHNARASEILATACRKVDDGSLFFEHGVIDTRCFPTDVLGQLLLVYGSLKEDCFPALKTLDEKEIDSLIALIAEGALDYPFSLFSRTKLETFCGSLVKRLVAIEETSPSETDSSTSDSSEPGES